MVTAATTACSSFAVRRQDQVGGAIEVPIPRPLLTTEVPPFGPIRAARTLASAVDAPRASLQVASRTAASGRPAVTAIAALDQIEAEVAPVVRRPTGHLPSSLAGPIDATVGGAPDTDATVRDAARYDGEVDGVHEVVPVRPIPPGRVASTWLLHRPQASHPWVRTSSVAAVRPPTARATKLDGTDHEGPVLDLETTTDEVPHPRVQMPRLQVAPPSQGVPLPPLLHVAASLARVTRQAASIAASKQPQVSERRSGLVLPVVRQVVVDGGPRLGPDGLTATAGAAPVAIKATRVRVAAFQVAEVLFASFVPLQEGPVSDVRARVPSITRRSALPHGLPVGVAGLSLVRRATLVARRPNAGAKARATASGVAATRASVVAPCPSTVATQTPRSLPLGLLVAGRLVRQGDSGPCCFPCTFLLSSVTVDISKRSGGPRCWAARADVTRPSWSGSCYPLRNMNSLVDRRRSGGGTLTNDRSSGSYFPSRSSYLSYSHSGLERLRCTVTTRLGYATWGYTAVRSYRASETS